MNGGCREIKGSKILWFYKHETERWVVEAVEYSWLQGFQRRFEMGKMCRHIGKKTIAAARKNNTEISSSHVSY